MHRGKQRNTYPWTFVSAAVEKVRAADCRATALLAKRAAVVRIMVNAFQYNGETKNSSAKNPENVDQNFYD
jgi:hypothetical protein